MIDSDEVSAASKILLCFDDTFEALKVENVIATRTSRVICAKSICPRVRRSELASDFEKLFILIPNCRDSWEVTWCDEAGDEPFRPVRLGEMV